MEAYVIDGPHVHPCGGIMDRAGRTAKVAQSLQPAAQAQRDFDAAPLEDYWHSFSDEAGGISLGDLTYSPTPMRKGAIILCGGKSSRMGRDKATLPFGPEQMLQRVVRLISEAVEVENMAVVAAPSQALPELLPGVLVVHDAHSYRGPLEGLATGLRALAPRAGAVYATACDVPLLVPAFVEAMFERLGDFDIAVPFDGQHHHPLAAVYRPSVFPHVERLLAAQRMRPRYLFDEVSTREIPVNDLRVVDPQLFTLENLNFLQDYHAALTTAGFAAPLDAQS